MEKLELKDLSPYLPYGLKIIDGWGDEKTLDYSYLHNVHCKPILRPISDLTEEIEHNGEKFIPILRLYNVSEENEKDYSFEYEFIESWGSGKILRVLHDKDIYTDFIYSDFCFYSSLTIGGEQSHLQLKNQYFLYTMLFEWHFDVFNLIKNKLGTSK